MTIKNSIAMAEIEQLLEELVRRGALVACDACILMDGRQVTKSAAEGITLEQVHAHLEVRALEVMSRGMAVARGKDRVHAVQIEPAAGDYAPGSLQATVKLLAVSVNLGR